MKIKINEITIDPAVAIREGTDEETILRYMENFDELPPIIVFQTDHKYLLADGFHRWAAAKRLGHTDIEVEIKAGDYNEASEFAIYANLKHGKPLSREEYKNAVRRLNLLHPDWGRIKLGKSIHRSDHFIQTVLKSDDVRTCTTVQVDDRIAETIHSAPKEKWNNIAKLAKEKDWTLEQAIKIVGLIKKNPNRTIDDIVNNIDILTKQSKEDEAIGLEVAKKAAGIKVETPEELSKAAERLRKEAKRKAQEAMTSEEKAIAQTKKETAQKERRIKTEQKKGELTQEIKLAIVQEAMKDPTILKQAESLIKQEEKRLKQEVKQKRSELAGIGALVKDSDRWYVEVGDINTYQTKQQFDFIITDPPYPKEFLPLYEVLAQRANEWLKPEGLLIAMCGQSYLDQIYKMLSNHLKYYWTAAYLTQGQPTPLRQRQVNSTWKPILIYSPSGNYKDKIFGDVYTSDKPEKDNHEWGQSISGMLSIIEQVCLPKDKQHPPQTIFDPFLGSGSTGVAALKHGCLFYGIDIDEQSVNISKKRLAEA